MGKNDNFILVKFYYFSIYERRFKKVRHITTLSVVNFKKKFFFLYRPVVPNLFPLVYRLILK